MIHDLPVLIGCYPFGNLIGPDNIIRMGILETVKLLKKIIPLASLLQLFQFLCL